MSLLAMLLAYGASSCGPETGPDAGSDGPPALPDADLDGIPDAYEGRPFDDDTDGDGQPDYLDLDSDDDGIEDAIEGQRPGGEPFDSDGDGVKDFRDLDSDGNGVPDSIEGGADLDGDRRPNCADDDDDADQLADGIEIDAMPDAPPDHDGDGAFDFQDADSDGDWVSDLEEATPDTDRDGVVDRFDLDTDGDGFPDADEVGDRNLLSRAFDLDADGRADFRDADADGDGISDRLEREHGTDRAEADTDGDGATDLIEIGAGTDPLDPSDHPRARGDFVFVMPYAEAPSPTRDVLDFATDLRRGDVYFLMDTTGSMDEEIATLRADLESVILPAIAARIPEARVGLGRYDDYPTNGYGGLDDVPYEHLLSMTEDTRAVIDAVATLRTHYGDDRPESAGSAMYAAVQGTSLDWPEPEPPDPAFNPHPVPSAPPACGDGEFGFPCFRPDAVPVIVNITDAPLHNGPGGSAPYSFLAPTYDEVLTALGLRHARVVWIDSGDATSRADGRRLAEDTGAVDAAGMGLVFPISRTGAGLTEAVVEGIRAVSAIAFDMSLSWRDDPSDAVDTQAAFVRSIAASSAATPDRGCAARPAFDSDADGVLDQFRDVSAGERVCFDIVPQPNAAVMPTLAPQVFRATLTVVGDGFTPLDERDVYFLVPPRIPDPGEPF